LTPCAHLRRLTYLPGGSSPDMLRTVFFFITFLPWTVFCLLAGLPLSLLSPDRYHNIGILWARIGLYLGGVKVKVAGAEHLAGRHPLIFMPNHQSNFDILILYCALNRQFRWLAKEELFRIPLFGLAMKRSGYIPVNRSDRKKAIASMNEAARRIAGGTSVVVFPEGTRTPDGRLLPFKKGGFMLALQAGVPIVPVAIAGSRRVMPKHSFSIRGGLVQVRIFPPIPTAKLTAADRDDLMGKVRDLISLELGEKDES